MYKIFTLDDSDEWMDIVSSFKESDVYYFPGYLKAFYENGDGEPLLFYMDNEYGRAINVFMRRDLHAYEGLKEYIKPSEYSDLSTVYGYGGPVFDAVDSQRLQECYIEELEKYCNDTNTVSEFIRFHPVLKNHLLLKNSYDVCYNRSTIYMDLSKGENHIWDSLAGNCRRNIRKAQCEGVSIISGRENWMVDEFIRLYIQTMRRENACAYYYFDKKFFYTTLNGLKENSLIFAAIYKQKVIGAQLIIFSDQLVYYHLAGSDIEYQSLRPNNLLIFEVAKWGSENGKKALYLGGGVCGDNDNLYRFKKSFSKTEPLSFYIGKKIYNEALYNKLVDIRVANDRNFNSNTAFFPKYRG